MSLKARDLQLLGLLDGPRWYLCNGQTLRLITPERLALFALDYPTEMMTNLCGHRLPARLAALDQTHGLFADWAVVEPEWVDYVDEQQLMLLP